MSNAPESVLLAARLQTGDTAAADAVYVRYGQRLAALAQSRLSRRLAARVDAEDVVQSALFCFFAGIQRGEFTIETSGALWNLLAKITLHKVAQQAERHHARKRSLLRETKAEPNEAERSTIANSPSSGVDDVAILNDELAWLYGRLDPLQRRTIELRLMGRDASEIAKELGPTERTIRRWIAQAEHTLTRRLSRDDAPAQTIVRPARPSAQVTDTAWLDYRDLLLEQQIGRGGVCRVYRAFHRGTGRRVAVKTLLPKSIASDALKDAFLREARIVARFCHPHIVPMLGMGQLPNGSPFLALQHIEGRDLSRVLQAAGPLPWQRAAAIVTVVAEALHYAHQLDVVHGDVTPANVLIGSDSHVWLTDFGLASLYRGGDSAPALGGTSGYIAPEVLDPSLGTLGPAADIYALGGLLWNLLSAEPPTDGARLCSGEAIDSALSELIDRCRAADPSLRPGSAADVARAITSLLNTVGHAPPPKESAIHHQQPT